MRQEFNNPQKTQGDEPDAITKWQRAYRKLKEFAMELGIPENDIKHVNFDELKERFGDLYNDAVENFHP